MNINFKRLLLSKGWIRRSAPTVYLLLMLVGWGWGQSLTGKAFTSYATSTTAPDSYYTLIWSSTETLAVSLEDLPYSVVYPLTANHIPKYNGADLTDSPLFVNALGVAGATLLSASNVLVGDATAATRGLIDAYSTTAKGLYLGSGPNQGIHIYRDNVTTGDLCIDTISSGAVTNRVTMGFSSGAWNFSGNINHAGTNSNISLGSNYLSGDGDDEGLSVSSVGNVTSSGTIGGTYVLGNGSLLSNLPSSSETDPQVGAIGTNSVPKWNGTALVHGSLVDTGSVVYATFPVGVGASPTANTKMEISGGMLRLLGSTISYPASGKGLEINYRTDSGDSAYITAYDRGGAAFKPIHLGASYITINDTEESNILWVQDGSATDPIADSWGVHSLAQYKENITELVAESNATRGQRFDTFHPIEYNKKVRLPKRENYQSDKEYNADLARVDSDKRNNKKFIERRQGIAADDPATPENWRAYDGDGNVAGLDMAQMVYDLTIEVRALRARVKQLEAAR